MKPTRRWWLGVALLGTMAAAGVAGLEQAREHERLQRSVEKLRGREREFARLRDEAARLERAQVSAEEERRLRADRAAVERIRAELAALKRRVEERARAATDGAGETAKRGKAMDKEFVPASEWRDRGRATPTAAVETLLWAAAGGNVGALAKAIELDPGAREQAERLLAEVPEAEREGCRTPEELVALLSATKVPLGEARITTPKPDAPPGVPPMRDVLLRNAAGLVRTVELQVNEAAQGDWRIVVPETAVRRYAIELSTGAGDGKRE